MAGRGPQSFKKRQKEQQRKEKQLEKAQRREERKTQPKDSSEEELVVLTGPRLLPEFMDDPDEAEDQDAADSRVVSKV
jgi:hypothetical protein